MRIAGINNPNHHHQPKQLQNNPSYDLVAVSEAGALPRKNSPSSANAASHSITPGNPNDVTPQSGELMRSTAQNLTGTSAATGERVRFYNNAGPQGGWNAYSSNGASPSPIPDNTSHKARTAIAEYLQMQFIEERQHFAEVLGVDDYA